MRSAKTMAALVVAILCGTGCASWTPVHQHAEWTLYVKDGESVDVDRFGRALVPAFAAVEERMGTFRGRVRVHAWDDEKGQTAAQPPEGPATGELQVVPGIGPARVRAYHVKGGAGPFQSSGVFLGTSDVGTAVHELVHARVADAGRHLPLWFEEGVASYFGDGALVDGRWIIDGLACWPLRELRESKIGDEELRRLLELDASDAYDARENLLVHFLGWAIVFDLARELPDANWQQWLERFETQAHEVGLLAAARTRLDSALAPRVEVEWLARLRSLDPGVRLAAAKGTWKLRNTDVIDALLDALEREAEPQVRAALALNVLLATNDTRLGRTRWSRVSNQVFPVLRTAELPDAKEQTALRDLNDAMRRWDSRRRRSTQDSLADLSRFWEE